MLERGHFFCAAKDQSTCCDVLLAEKRALFELNTNFEVCGGNVPVHVQSVLSHPTSVNCLLGSEHSTLNMVKYIMGTPIIFDILTIHMKHC